MTARTVSVIVPVYNGQLYLAEAIGSILAQQDMPREVIVVDDGSEDLTSQIMAGFGDRLICVRQQNLGPAAARNAGIARASSPLIAFLDADDLWLPSTVKNHLACMASNPDADIVWGLSDRLFMPDAGAIREDWHGRQQWALSVGSMLFRRTILEDAGGFDETLRAGEDMDLVVRLRDRATIIQHHGVVQRIRYHAGSLSTDEPEMRQAHYRVIGKAMARQRLKRGPGRADGK